MTYPEFLKLLSEYPGDWELGHNGAIQLKSKYVSGLILPDRGGDIGPWCPCPGNAVLLTHLQTTIYDYEESWVPKIIPAADNHKAISGGHDPKVREDLLKACRLG